MFDTIFVIRRYWSSVTVLELGKYTIYMHVLLSDLVICK